jgi:hypothetical protein
MWGQYYSAYKNLDPGTCIPFCRNVGVVKHNTVQTVENGGLLLSDPSIRGLNLLCMIVCMCLFPFAVVRARQRNLEAARRDSC